MRDEDIFRRLKKETPLVKRRDLQPLSQKDFEPKQSSFDMRVQKKGGQRKEQEIADNRPVRGKWKDDESGFSWQPDEPSQDSGIALRETERVQRETERVQRLQPRTIQARSETRIRTGAEPFKRPEIRTVSVPPQQKLPDEPETPRKTVIEPPNQITLDMEPRKAQPRPQNSTGGVPLQRRLTDEPEMVRQPDKKNAEPQRQIALDMEPKMRTPADEPRPVPETVYLRKPSIRDAYSRADAAELEMFSEASPKRAAAMRAGSPKVPPVNTRRTEFEEYYEPVQGAEAPAFRHELKFYINYTEYILLRNTLKAIAQIDKYAGENGEYYIRSLYFDDEYESALREKMCGSDTRKKYRIRIYNFKDDVIKFEKKIKQGQFITKKSIKISRNEYDSILAGEYSFLLRRKEPLASELFLELTNNRLRPRVFVDYVREAYVYPWENIRITFDKDLRSGMWLTDIFDPYAPTMPMYDEGLMVLEVKFEKSLPAHIRGVLNNIRTAERSAISKYVICRKFE